MSFLKITDPKKREQLVEEFLKTKRNIQNQQLAERLGEQEALTGLTKQFKPVTDAQKHLEQRIVGELKPIKESIQEIPSAIKVPVLPALTQEDDDEESTEEADTEYIGDLAARYLKKFTTNQADTTYGIHSKNNQFYIGDARIGVIGNNIMVGDKEYEGTPGLWELIVMKVPRDEDYTQDDYEKYAEIMVKTNALRYGKKAGAKPMANRGWKWKYLLKTIWNEKDRYEGKGLEEPQTVILPSDPNALLERLDLLLASKAVGNTGVRNEIVSICDELKR